MKPWQRYFDALDKRLEQGQKEYGDKSFCESTSELLDEIQQEVLDIAGWSYILWERLERLKK